MAMADDNSCCLGCGGPLSGLPAPAEPPAPAELAAPEREAPDPALILVSVLGIVVGSGLGWLLGDLEGALVGALIGFALPNLILTGGLGPI